MKEYEVTLYYHRHVVVNVTAEDEEGAIDTARSVDLDSPQICFVSDWVEDSEPDVEEKEP